MGVNKHLTHIEELVLTRGNDGANDAIDILKKVGETLNPTGVPGVTITTKWDGAPAVICGIDPADGKFFVGTKSVFNTQEPKIAKSTSDVARMYSGELANKLTTCYQYLRPVVTNGILQGDLLFTNDKSVTNIMGKSLLSFRPNTITYAVEPDSTIGRKIANANVGIVFHTKYSGPSMDQLNASFGVSKSDYSESRDVFATAATFTNVGGVASFSQDEYQKYQAAVRQAEGSVKKAGGIFSKIQSGKKSLQFDTLFLQFFNGYYRGGENIPGVTASYNAFVQYLAGQYNTQIQKNKTLQAQADKAFKFVDAIDFMVANQQQIQMLIAAYLNIAKAKILAVRKMNQVGSLQTFVETSNGYKVTAPEGYVAISGGQAVKLIDRIEFANLNFNVPKKW